MRLLFSSLLFMILTSSLVLGLGVTPTIQNFYYEPNALVHGSFDVWNNEGSTLQFYLFTSGPLASGLQFEKKEYTLDPDQWVTIDYIFTMPASLKQTTFTSIYLSSLPPSSSAQLGIVPSIRLETRVRILLPSDQIAVQEKPVVDLSSRSSSAVIANFTVAEYQQDRFVKFSFSVENPENYPLADVHASVAIANADTGFTTVLTSPSFSVASKSAYPVDILWNLPDSSSQTYTFTTTLYQAEKALTQTATHLQISSSKAYFSNMPSRTPLTVGITLLLFIVLLNILYVLYRKYVRR